MTQMHQNEELTTEQIEALVIENRGWAESIARSVARSWNLDWEMDGLDGAAMEALFFCARRFLPSKGIPFKGYARKRIHEASSDAARKCKGWKRRSKSESEAYELSQNLLNVFPELRVGEMPDSDGDVKGAIRSLLIGATLLTTSEAVDEGASPDDLVDHKRIVEVLANLEPVHQIIMWKIYWEGDSMRTVASEWGTDELNVIREHKILIAHLSKCLATKRPLAPPKIRPGLKVIASKLKKESNKGSFKAVLDRLAA